MSTSYPNTHDRRLSTSNFWRLQYLDLFEKVDLIPTDLVDASSMVETIKIPQLYEVYHLVVQSFERLMRPLDVNYLQGDYSKAKKKLGLKPKVKFDELERITVKEDLNKWKRWQSGERFPWDATNYPNEVNILTRTLRV